MVLVAGCLGLRVSEIVGLQWRDFDFPGRTLLVQRSIVHGRVGDVKTEYSRDSVPLDPALVEALLRHKERSCSTRAGWLFANPVTAGRTTKRRFKRRTSAKPGLVPGSAAISDGTRSGTAIDRGWTKPGRLSPSKRS
jgi:integrase